ncbi:Serine/threonine-protein kinase PrkC [Roseimaritima multifibrata]|uniref:Serine/threonine-protein kinase PrkC n=1 Tax=Roseimaritima multifibrata TaxID=1930274 RepID=A0A517MF34_9BACT|nr:protein kinase [Roseimaritima multifibrata]QDS93498.1 Serine/threonine-protein kinase PrkC [Roseimaritima multifibrata]
MTLLPETIDLPSRFELRGPCGTGRFGVVYFARDTKLKRDVALKVTETTNRSPLQLKRIRQEIRISCRLRHPAIVSAFDAMEIDNFAILVLPMIHGGSLAESINHKPADQRQAVIRLLQMTEAVAYLHRTGILHGDLKPANVLIDGLGKPHLCDFGSSTLLTKSKNITANEIAGTPAYLAPELAAGDAKATVVSEIYSLGAILFFLLVGKPPFEGTTTSILSRIQSEPFPTLRSVNVQADKGLQAILAKACHSTPAERYQSAEALEEDLRALLEDRPLAARRDSMIRRSAMWAKRHRATAVLAASLFLAVTLGTIAGTTGWSYAISQKNASNRSRSLFQAKARKAKLREESLQQTLATISKQRQAIAIATDAERKMLLKAESASREVLEKSTSAARKLAETQRLVAKTRIVESERQQTERNSQFLLGAKRRRENFVNFLTDRRELINRFHKEDNWHTNETTASQTLSDSIRGLLTEELTQRFSQSADLHYQPFSVVFETNGREATILPAAQTETLKRILYGVERIPERDLPLSAATSVGIWVPRVGDYSPDGSNLCLAGPSADGESVVARISIETNQSVRSYRCPGQVHAIVCGDSDFELALVSLKGDIQVVRFPDEKILFSAMEEREKIAPVTKTPRSSGDLLPFFIDIGTNPNEHLLLASSSRPDGESTTAVFLHSLDLRSSEHVVSTSFDCGMQKLANWPHQWQLSDHTYLGIGKRCLTTLLPAPLGNRRYSGNALIGAAAYSSSFQKCETEWGPIATPPSPTESPGYLGPETLLRAKSDSFDLPVTKDYDRSTQPYRMPSFDSGSGIATLWYSDGFTAFDVYDGRIIRESTIPQGPADARLVRSAQSDRWIRFSKKQIRWAELFKPKSEIFKSVEATDLHLGLIAARLKGEPPIPVNQTQAPVTAPLPHVPVLTVDNSSKIRPNGGGVRFDSLKQRLDHDAAHIGMDSPFTLELIAKLAPSNGKDQRGLARLLNYAFVISPDGRGEFRRELPRGPNNKWNQSGILSKEKITDRWVHLACVTNGVDKVRFYIDGELIGSNKWSPEVAKRQKRQSKFLLNDFGGPPLGIVDSVRISHGERYDGTFVPSLPMTADQTTAILYNLDGDSDNRAIDSSGNNHTGRLRDPQWVQFAGPNETKPDSAVSKTTKTQPSHATGYYLGANSKANQFELPKIPLNASQPPLTLEAVVKLSHPRPEGTRGILGLWGYYLGIRESGTPVFRRDLTIDGKWGHRFVTGDRSIVSRWVHLAGVTNGSNELKLFVDGKLVGISKVPFADLDEAGQDTNLQINSWPQGAINGWIDSVRVSQSARYETDFEPQLPFVADDHTLVLYDFNEGKGNHISDSSGNGRDGTLVTPEWLKTSQYAKD